MIIYKVTNTVNGKIYIGQTVQPLLNRWSKHCSNSGCTALHQAILKYGRENFTVEQINEAGSQEELDQKEQLWIAHYDCVAPKGYNLTNGGESKKIVSEITRKKIGEKNRGKNISDWQKERIAAAWRGKKHTPQYREHMSELYQGSGNPGAKAVICVETGMQFDTARDAAKSYGINHSNIVQVCKGKRKTAGKFHWKYV